MFKHLLNQKREKFVARRLCRNCLVLLLSVLLAGISAGPATAQKGRYLQSIYLSAKANKPSFTDRHHLPSLVLKGISQQEITPYYINYKENRAEPFGTEGIAVLLNKIWPTEPDTIPLYSPWDFYNIVADVTKGKKNSTQVNYLHFTAVTDFPLNRASDHSFMEYVVFSVRFDEVAAFLDKEKALWVVNEHPVMYKGQVVHTADQSPLYLLQEEAELPWASFIQVNRAADYSLKELVYYDIDHQARRTEDFAATSAEPATINFLSEAIRLGMLKPAEEAVLTTKVKPVVYKAAKLILPNQFQLTEYHKLYLQRPENAALAELPLAVTEAIEKNWLQHLYTDKELLHKQSKAEWNEKLEIKNDLFIQEESEERMYHLPQSLSVITVSWMVTFTPEGQVQSMRPHALGFAIASSHTPEGLEQQIGFIRFDELYSAIKAKGTTAQLSLLDHLRNHKYAAYLDQTSGVSVAAGK